MTDNLSKTERKIYAKTERLTISSPLFSDAEEIARARSTEFVMRHNLYARCDANQIISEIEDYEIFLLTEAKTHKIIGCISYREDNFRYHISSIALQAWLIEEMAYQGYMEEALRAIIPYLFTKYDMLSVEIFSENTASIRLAKKLGFEQYGFIRKAILTPDGKIVDLILMSIEKTDTST